jgi:short-subunit dehydrogenase
MHALIIGDGGVSKGFQKALDAKNIKYTVYSRETGNLLDLPTQVDIVFDLIIYAVGDIVWRRIVKLEKSNLEEIFTPNLYGFIILSTIIPKILKQKGHIIILGADLTRITLPNLSLYAASKAALETFVKIAQKEMRRYNFIYLQPHEIDTPIWQKVPITPQNPISSEAFATQTLKDLGY